MSNKDPVLFLVQFILAGAIMGFLLCFIAIISIGAFQQRVFPATTAQVCFVWAYLTASFGFALWAGAQDFL